MHPEVWHTKVLLSGVPVFGGINVNGGFAAKPSATRAAHAPKRHLRLLVHRRSVRQQHYAGARNDIAGARRPRIGPPTSSQAQRPGGSPYTTPTAHPPQSLTEWPTNRVGRRSEAHPEIYRSPPGGQLLCSDRRNWSDFRMFGSCRQTLIVSRSPCLIWPRRRKGENTSKEPACSWPLASE